MDESTNFEQTAAKEYQKTNRLAVASLAIACFTVTLLPFLLLILFISIGNPESTPALVQDVVIILILASPVLGLASIILGAVGIRSIKKRAPRQAGIGLAITGVAIGAFLFIGAPIAAFLLFYFFWPIFI